MCALLSDSLKKIVDVSEEKDVDLKKKLQEISKKEKAVVMACIAPYVGKKVSPTKTLWAELGTSEEFAIETVIEQIKDKTDAKTLYLLLNSPGGYVRSSYKIARALRKNFKEIKVFVPHVATSGGTLVALTGNEIVMGMMSQLSPVDPYTLQEKRQISAKSLVDGFETVTAFFQRTSEEDAPYTYKVLAQKYDAEQLDRAISALMLMQDYITEILTGSGYEKKKANKIAKSLVRDFKNHGEVINFDRAKKIELNVVRNDRCPEEWSLMREWLGDYLLQSTDKHIVRYVISKELLKKQKKSNKKHKRKTKVPQPA